MTTYKILSIYIKLIDVMKMIDPSTVMLEDISEPLKAFLLQRQDTLRCMVNFILFDQDQRLFEQLDNQRYQGIPSRKAA
jgi:anaphase-promoting complex subunit 2